MQQNHGTHDIAVGHSSICFYENRCVRLVANNNTHAIDDVGAAYRFVFIVADVQIQISCRVESEVTSFVLAGLSVAQLIFMSETGVIILRSSLPITFSELVVIFLLRTVIVLPVLIVGAHLVV